MENVNLNDNIQTQFDAEVQIAANNAQATFAKMMAPTFMGNKANVVGALLGTAAATVLEAVSRNGTAASIVGTAVTGLAMTGASYNNLKEIPNTATTSAVAGGMMFVTSRCVGRSIAEYFPASEELEETI